MTDPQEIQSPRVSSGIRHYQPLGYRPPSYMRPPSIHSLSLSQASEMSCDALYSICGKPAGYDVAPQSFSRSFDTPQKEKSSHVTNLVNNSAELFPYGRTTRRLTKHRRETTSLPPRGGPTKRGRWD